MHSITLVNKSSNDGAEISLRHIPITCLMCRNASASTFLKTTSSLTPRHIHTIWFGHNDILANWELAVTQAVPCLLTTWNIPEPQQSKISFEGQESSARGTWMTVTKKGSPVHQKHRSPTPGSTPGLFYCSQQKLWSQSLAEDFFVPPQNSPQ